MLTEGNTTGGPGTVKKQTSTLKPIAPPPAAMPNIQLCECVSCMNNPSPVEQVFCGKYKKYQDKFCSKCSCSPTINPLKWVKKIYCFALIAAAEDPRSAVTGLFLRELYITDYFAYDMCCETIATEIIGG